MVDAQRLQAHIIEHANRSPTPAIGVAVFDAEGSLVEVVRGTADLTTDRPVSDKDWWDLASLTKTLVTLPEVLDLVDQGRVELDQPLADAWPSAHGHPVGAATLGELMSFNAGLPAVVDYFRTLSGAARIIEAVLATPLERPIGAGAVYSDLSYMLLGELVTSYTGRSLATLAKKRSGLRFAPLPGPAVATERCPWRNRLIIGEVHDENAAAMGGVAGHAGAFGTLALVAAAGSAWLAERVVSPRLHALARRCWAVTEDGYPYGLGWWLAPRQGLGGFAAGPDGYGCTGFVGNRLWLEPSFGYGVCIVSNRIHPSRFSTQPFLDWCDNLFLLVAEEFHGKVHTTWA